MAIVSKSKIDQMDIQQRLCLVLFFNTKSKLFILCSIMGRIWGSMQRSQFLYGALIFGDGPEVNTKVCRTNHNMSFLTRSV
jgi:hypothetical protein